MVAVRVVTLSVVIHFVIVSVRDHCRENQSLMTLLADIVAFLFG
jgi:hypothetical protein